MNTRPAMGMRMEKSCWDIAMKYAPTGTTAGAMMPRFCKERYYNFFYINHLLTN